MAFSNSLKVILTGSVVAQSISIVGGWLLARWLYAPAPYGQFAWSWSLALMFSQQLTGTYDNFIVAAPTDTEAERLAHKACYNTHRFGLLLLSVALLSYFVLPVHLQTTPWWTIPAAAWLIALTNIRIQLDNRLHRDKSLTQLRILQSAAILFFQLLFGFLHHANGLIYGGLAGLSATLPWIKPPPATFKRPLTDNMQIWHRQALQTQPAILLNAAYINLQPVLIHALFGAHTTGLFTLAQRLVQAPAQIIMGAVRLVWQREAKARQQNPAHFFAFYRQSLIRLFWLLALPLVMFFGVAATTVEWAFGPAWSGLADLLVWLSLAAAAQAMFSPLSGIIELTHKAIVGLWLNIWFVAGISVAWLTGYFLKQFYTGLQLTTCLIAVGYVAAAVYFWWYLKRHSTIQ